MTASIAEIYHHASASAFGNALVNNAFRAVIVEAIVDKALPDDWTW